MKLRIEDKIKIALKYIKEDINDDVYFDVVKHVIERGIRLYIKVGGGKKCKHCRTIISSSATSGLCRACYAKEYHKTEKYKEKKRRYRLRHKKT